jgi:chromate transporter
VEVTLPLDLARVTIARRSMSEAITTGSLAPRAVPSLWAFVAYFARLGALGFGGPIALAGYMQRDLVEERGWITKEDYVQGLALAQLAPGPLAAQLAIYLGWVRAGVTGATLVGIAFVLPSFVMVLALSATYVRFGGLSWMQAAFYGVGAAVVAIVARSAAKLTKMTLAKDRLLWGIAGVSAAMTIATESEALFVFVLAGVLAMIVRARPSRSALAVVVAIAAVVVAVSFAPAALASTTQSSSVGDRSLVSIGWFFTRAGAFVFGSGLAIVPFLYRGVVHDYAWLNEQQFLDAVAVAMITPGPVVITVGFIGYLARGPLGAVVAGLGTFLPCWLFVVLPAPYMKRLATHAPTHAFTAGVTAAATGAIIGAAWVLGRKAVVDVPTALIALGTLALLMRFKKTPEPLVIVAAALIGALVRR